MATPTPSVRERNPRLTDVLGQNLLDPILRGRNPLQRFTLKERSLLAQNMREVWEVSPERVGRVPIHGLSDIICVTNYKDGDNQLLKLAGLEIGDELDLIAYLETPTDVFRLRSLLNSVGNPETTLATMILPAERGDRPEVREDGFEEVVDLKTHLQDLALAGVTRLIVSGAHSPVLAYSALEAGVAVADFVAHPAMFDRAVKESLFKGKTIVPVTGDDGAAPMGRLVEKLAAEHGIPSFPSVHADKTKIGNVTKVHFKQEELKTVEGKIAVIPEDVISTGGTLGDTIYQLIAAGATHVVILATYSFFAEGAYERLANKEYITIITTDGKKPLRNISSAENIIQIPILSWFAVIMDLDRQGVDFWGEEGRKKLRELGFCFNPWMVEG